ncbi:MAG: bifunctional metallophosphatase/5'-nucleotidase [Chitinophagales bacterium]
MITYLRNICFPLIILLIGAGFSSSTPSEIKNDKRITITLFQLNDIYEISPLNNGAVGGMARAATVISDLEKENRNTYVVVAGDFLSPTAIGTLPYNKAGDKMAGIQMVETMNQAGVDLVTFGNHEFDIKQKQLSAAINASKFEWVSSNVTETSTGKPFNKISGNDTTPLPITKIVSFKDEDGTTVKIGFFAITIITDKSPNPQYEYYDDYINSAGKAVAALKGNCDILVAITHLSLSDDKKLAAAFPEINMIIGGHEHINSYNFVGNTIIAKADANEKSGYIHYLTYDHRTKKTDITSRLIGITNSIPEDSVTGKVVDKWNGIADSVLHAVKKMQPCLIIDSVSTPLDGTEAGIRTQQTNLGNLICESFRDAAGMNTDLAMMNSGSIRLDDYLSGYITEYDIFRVLPFDGNVMVKKMKGSFIDSLIQTNPARANIGSYLQFSGISFCNDTAVINSAPINHDKWYTVALNDFLGNNLQDGLKVFPTETIPMPQPSTVQSALIKKIKSIAAPISDDVQNNDLIVPCY